MSTSIDPEKGTPLRLVVEFVRVEVEIGGAGFLAFPARPGAIYHRMLGPVNDVTVYPLLWGRAVVCVGPAGADEDGGFNLRLEFDTPEEAIRHAHSYRA